MRVRSPRLLAVSLVLLVSGGGLALILQHDGELEAGHTRLASAERGEDVVLKAALRPLPGGERRDPAATSPILLNHTYVAVQEEGLLVLATHPAPLPVETTLVLEGEVLLHAGRGDGSVVVVVRVEAAQEPLLFR